MTYPLPTSTFSGDRGTGSPLWIVDLCCGCGMASLGLMSAGGYEVLAGVDSWYDATEAYVLNHGNDHDYVRDAGWVGVEEALHAIQGDYPVDVVLTGPPCQDDSRAHHGSDNGRGMVKAPALDVALALEPTWVLMEMVTTRYADWCRLHGARQVIKLVDCDLGGMTTRTRWVAVWGPRDLQVEPAAPRGWGAAFPRQDLAGCLLATEADSAAKRWRYAKRPDEPARACVGGDRRHILRTPDGRDVRLGPADEAALSGFRGLQLQRVEHMSSHDRPDGWRWTYGAQTERAANTMVGNGWPASYGYALGRAMRR